MTTHVDPAGRRIGYLLIPPELDEVLRSELDAVAQRGRQCIFGCGRCSQCIRAAWIERHGGDHSGGPVEWEEVAE